MHSYLETLWERICCEAHSGCWQNFFFPFHYRTESLSCLYEMVMQCNEAAYSSSLCGLLNIATYLTKPMKRIPHMSLLARKSLVYHNITTGVRAHHCCNILLARSKSWLLLTLKGKGLYKITNIRRWGS